MEKAKFKIKQVEKSKHDEEWKEQAEEMTKWFSVNCFTIFHRLQRVYIDEGFRVCKEKEIHNIKYFWGVVKNNKAKTNEFKRL